MKSGFAGYSTSRSALKQEDESKIVNTDITNLCNVDNTPAVTLSSTIQLDTATIDEQKKRAKKFWNDSSYNEDLKEAIDDDVVNHLDQGLVLPIFHTLCRPPDKRLFIPNTRVGKEDENCSDVIQLSAAPVTMGVCKVENDEVGEVSHDDDMSYISAFFKNTNIGCLKVEDSNFYWEFDVDYTKYVTALVNTPGQMVGEDVEVIKLLHSFHIDVHNGNHLISRRLSRGVVADCFEQSELGSTNAIVGSSGIGKSWTLIYTLQQALLYENACVVFCFQKLSKAIVCIRRNNQIFVWKNQHVQWRLCCFSNLFDNSNVLALLDPKVSQKGGAECLEGRRMLIMAASNDINHFYSSKKTTPDIERILSVFTEKELIVALPYMVEGQKYPPTINEMLERAKIVGPIPQYIVSTDSFIRRKRETAIAINKLYNEEIKEFLSFDGLIEKNCISTGCLFYVNVAGQAFYKDGGSDDNECDRIDNVGYDGHLILNYWNREISYMSDAILKAIAKCSRKTILSFASMNKYWP